jgi:hypothetical protein
MTKVWGLFLTGSRGWEIQANDGVVTELLVRGAAPFLPGEDDMALRRARQEAARGRRFAMEAVAIHQRERRLQAREARQ